MKKVLFALVALMVAAAPADAQSMLEKMKQKAEEKVNSAVGGALGKMGEKLSNSEKKDENGKQTTGSSIRTGLGSILTDAANATQASSASPDEVTEYAVNRLAKYYYGDIDTLAARKYGAVKQAGAIFAAIPKTALAYPGVSDAQMAAYLKALDQADLDLAASMYDLMKRCGQISIDTDKMQRELDAQYAENEKIRKRQQAAMEDGSLNESMELSMKMMSMIMTESEMKQMQAGKFTLTEAEVEKRTAALLNMTAAEYKATMEAAEKMSNEEQKVAFTKMREKATPKGKQYLDYAIRLKQIAPKASGGLSEYEELKYKILELQSKSMTDMLGGMGDLNLAGMLGNADDEIYTDDSGKKYTKFTWELYNAVSPKYLAYEKALGDWHFPDITTKREETWMNSDPNNYIYRKADAPDLSKKKAVEDTYKAIEPAVAAVFGKYAGKWAKKISDADAAFKKANDSVNGELVTLLNKAIVHPDCPESDRVGWQMTLYMIELVPLQKLQASIEKRRELVDAMLYYPEYMDKIELTGDKYNDFKLVYAKTMDYAWEGKYPDTVNYCDHIGWGFERRVDKDSPLIGKTIVEMLDAVKPCQISYKDASGIKFDVTFGDGYQMKGKAVFDSKNRVIYYGSDEKRYRKYVHGTSGVENEFNKIRIKQLADYFAYFSNGPYHEELLEGKIRYVGEKKDTTATVAGRACTVYVFGMDLYHYVMESNDNVDYVYVDKQTGAVLKLENCRNDGARYTAFEAVSVKNGAPALDRALIRKQLGITSPDNDFWAHGCSVERSFDVAWDAEGWKTMMGVQGWNDVIPAYSGTGFVAESYFAYDFDKASVEIHNTSEADARAYAEKLVAAGFKGGEWHKVKGAMEWSASFDGGEAHGMSAHIQMSKDGKSFILSVDFDGSRKPWITYV